MKTTLPKPIATRKAKIAKVFETKRIRMAGTTGLEPATSDVTGRRSNQLNYDSALERSNDANRSSGTTEWAVLDSNQWPPVCKTDALPLS